MYAVITQLIGFIGTGLMIGSFQCKKSRNLFLFQMSSNAMYAVHFIMLGAFTGSVIIFISLFRNLVLYKHRSKWAQWRGWMPLFIAVYLITTVLTWEDYFSALPCLAMVTLTLFSWSRNGRKIRLANFFVAQPSWIIYEIHTFSISGVISDAFSMGSIAVSFVRYGWKALDGEG